MRSLAIFVSFACAGTPAKATTLRQMGLAEMAQKASLIVRATITGSSGIVRGSDVYTAYRFKTLETIKPGKTAVVLAVPGGVAGEIRQVVTGAPVLRVGHEYVLFLWTDRSGLTQAIGMSQGLFTVNRATGRDVLATRSAQGEQMLDSAGRSVHSEAQSIPLAELRAMIFRVLKRDSSTVLPATPPTKISTGVSK